LGGEGGKHSLGSRSNTAAFAAVAVAIAFFATAVIAAGFGRYVMSVVSLVSGLAILSYVVEVKRYED